jgi:hypothetical protein
VLDATLDISKVPRIGRPPHIWLGIILAHSEEYCPVTADALIPIIQEYLYETL